MLSCRDLIIEPSFKTVNPLNRPFPSNAGPLHQNEVKYSAFDMEIIFILVQIKLISTIKVVRLAHFEIYGVWNSEMAFSILYQKKVKRSMRKKQKAS